MNTNNLNTALYEKMATEQEKYRDWLKSQPPEEILHHTYEYTVREDIVMAMEELELTDAQAQALLESPSPLADVYRYFEKLETGYMDMIRDSIENRADDVCKAQEELRTAPLYPHSAAYASEHGEMAQYNRSYQANSACKEAIEQTISAHYAENRLDTEAAVKDVLEKFGTERVQFILANTIQHKNHDGRISQDNKAWAKTIPMPEDSGASRHCASWPAVLERITGTKYNNYSRGGMTAREYVQSWADTNGFWQWNQAYIIALGNNDSFVFGHPLGSVKDVNADCPQDNGDTFLGNMGKIVSKLKTIEPNARIFVVTPQLRGEACDNDIRYIASELAKLCDMFEFTYLLDMTAHAPVYDAEMRKSFGLGFHPNPMGYYAYALTVGNYIDYIIRSNPQEFATIPFVGTLLKNKDYK